MLHFLPAHRLDSYPVLRDGMFTDRTRQFRDRLGWPLEVDADGGERDFYDGLDPLYLIWETDDGRHGGSVRCLPSTGPILINDHFAHIAGRRIVDPRLWECTRFLVSPDQEAHSRSTTKRISAALLLGCAAVIDTLGLYGSLGIIYSHTMPLYHRMGVYPEVLGTHGEGRAAITVGIWRSTGSSRAGLTKASGLDPEILRFAAGTALPLAADAPAADEAPGAAGRRPA